MFNYFFTIKSHIIDLFMVGRVMQYRFEIDVVPLLVGLVYLGVGDGPRRLHGDGDGGLLVHVVASWAWEWPVASSGDPLVVGVRSWWWCQ